MQKPSNPRWLAREKAVPAVRKSLPALVSTFEEIHDETGDAEAHGIATLLTKYNTVACIYMLSDVLHTVAKLQGNLQAKEVDLAGVVDRTKQGSILDFLCVGKSIQRNFFQNFFRPSGGYGAMLPPENFEKIVFRVG